MKNQTFITKVIDKNGKTLDFERWTHKKADTVRKKVEFLYSIKCNSLSRLYLPTLKQGEKILCVPTPDGYHEKGDPVWEISTEYIINHFFD